MGVQVHIGSTLESVDRRAPREVAPRTARTFAEERAKVKGIGILTPRLAWLADLVAKGWSYKKCAGAMGIAEMSVKVYASDILNRVGVASRSEFMVYWRRERFANWIKQYGSQIPFAALSDLSAIFDPENEANKQRWLD